MNGFYPVGLMKSIVIDISAQDNSFMKTITL
jgi:hypothetical protein